MEPLTLWRSRLKSGLTTSTLSAACALAFVVALEAVAQERSVVLVKDSLVVVTEGVTFLGGELFTHRTNPIVRFIARGSAVRDLVSHV
jgi:hypothetical protein